jgi:hypothetical protein
MGPPKKGNVKPSYAEELRLYDIFEYRLNESDGSYYFYNPYTGETMFQTEFEDMDRYV